MLNISQLVGSVLIAGLSAARGSNMAPAPEPNARIDHIIIAVPDLEHTIQDLSKTLGVTPIYGGKHPRGTHNALLSLDSRTYVEFIALQPGVSGSSIGMQGLDGVTHPTPVGWAVSASSAGAISAALGGIGLRVTSPQPGSRTTPAGEVLKWETFSIEPEPAGSPFFITWSPGSPHPATTSPRGCTLTRFEIATPEAKQLQAASSALHLPVTVVSSSSVRYSVSLQCPAGPVVFETGSTPGTASGV